MTAAYVILYILACALVSQLTHTRTTRLGKKDSIHVQLVEVGKSPLRVLNSASSSAVAQSLCFEEFQCVISVRFYNVYAAQCN
jgi:hypothetical protein